jgi:protein SCO1
MIKRNVFFLPILFLVLSFVFGFIIYLWTEDNQGPGPTLGIVQPISIENRELVDTSMRLVTHGHVIDTFSLTDQNSNAFKSAEYDGKIYIADFFFVSCGSICPIMNTSMARVRDEFKDNDSVKFLSFTVLPEMDNSSVLLEYSKKFDVNPDQWKFLTGDKQLIYNLARKSYFTLKPSEVGDGEHSIESDFIHTDNLVLIDGKKRIRKYYSGIEDLEVDQLIKDIRRLLIEMNE